MWDPHGPGIEPISPALADGFLTIGPPGKPQQWKFMSYHSGRLGSTSSLSRQIQGLLRACFLVHRYLSSCCVLIWLGSSVGCLYMALNPIHEGSILTIQSPPKGPYLLISSPWGFGFQHMNWEGHKHSDHRNLILGKFPVPYETKSYFMNMASQTEISPRFECFNFCFGWFYYLICVSTFQHFKII